MVSWCLKEQFMRSVDSLSIGTHRRQHSQRKIGKVAETFPGKDGRILTVRVQTKKGMINRLVQKLHWLEQVRLPLATTAVQRDEEPFKVQ